MIVWLASFPRSGNTLLRMTLHRLYGVTSSTVYDEDGVAERLGPELVGYRRHQQPYEELRADDAIHFIKTHRPHDGMVQPEDRVVQLIRDGRDAVVSWAHLRAEQPGRDVGSELRALVTRPERTGAGRWGTNVVSWLQAPIEGLAVVRFDQLIAEPVATVTGAVHKLGLSLELDRSPGSNVGRPEPNFEELQAIDPGFFRSGKVGVNRQEMPVGLTRLFLAHPDNQLALRRLGADTAS